jgi:hypothetical protein
MSEKNLFEFVKGMLKGGPTSEPAPMAPRKQPYRYEAPPTSQVDPDQHNPATITRIGKSNDGRELVMTLGFGTFLVDRETPTICYYHQGGVGEIPTPELQNLSDALFDKRAVGKYAANYVDLLNVVSHEIEVRKERRGLPSPAAAPRPLPKKGVRASAPPPGADQANPATILRVGKSRAGAELVMTLGLGTFVVHRDVPDIKYFDRGREWEVPDMELQLLVDSLMAKENTKEHRYAYIDLLNVASFVIERRRQGGFRG